MSDAISDNFTTVKNASRAWPFGGGAVCSACLWACRSIALRCALFFATERGIWFVSMRPIPDHPETRPDPLSALLSPPEPPFVAGLPLYGVDHGGEANAHRAVWPWTEGDGLRRLHPCLRTVHPDAPARLFVPANPLLKLQSKHTALYATVSFSRERYRLQVDDAGDVTVDVRLWRSLRPICDGLLLDMRNGGVGAIDARDALTTLRPPTGYLVRTEAWRARVEPLRAHVDGRWWALFTSLLLMPDLVKKPRATWSAATL
jgi:hypothetical protein